MRSLQWLAQRLPGGGPCRRDRRHRQRARHQRESRTETVGGLASRKPELRRLARWAARRRLCARSRARDQSRSERQRRRRSRLMVRRGRPFRQLPRQPILCRRRDRGGHRRRARPQQRPNHARRAARGRSCRPAARDRPNAAATSDISRPISSRAGRSKAAALSIGVVTSIVGIWQYRITFTGEQNHAGTTRMADRRDAGLALARFCVDIDERFPPVCGPRTVWTTGSITLEPGAPSIIPGSSGNAVPDARR